MAELNEHQIQEVTSEILEHIMDPKNYGELENPSCVGMGIDQNTGEFALIYLAIDGTQELIVDIKFGTNACQDTVVAGSLFTEMIKGMPLAYAQDAASRLEVKLQDAPPKQRACSLLILKAFEGSVLHKNELANGEKIDMCRIALEESCEGDDDTNQIQKGN